MDENRKKEIEEYAERKSSEPIFGSSRSKDDAEYRKAMQENAPYLTLGIQLAGTIAVGAAIGWWIDKNNGTNLWLGICAGLGAFFGLGYFILTVLRLDKKEEESKKKRPPEGGYKSPEKLKRK